MDLTLTLDLTPEHLANLCGPCQQNLRHIEHSLAVQIHHRGNLFVISGTNTAIHQAQLALQELALLKELTPITIHRVLQIIKGTNRTMSHKTTIHTQQLTITPHSENQSNYIQHLRKFDINFSIGPAGTGKTFLAVACAVEALNTELVKRIVLVRPVVEAGEHLGFLPGDIAQKIDPYLRPLYDALYEMLGVAQVERLIANHVIEIAPLAFMRGRTLNNSFIILDESQNTTKEQMKMLLTRIGFGSKAVITGDITQIDLAKKQLSGLVHALEILKEEPDISFNYFQTQDVVRHPLVQRIITAYEKNQSPNS